MKTRLNIHTSWRVDSVNVYLEEIGGGGRSFCLFVLIARFAWGEPTKFLYVLTSSLARFACLQAHSRTILSGERAPFPVKFTTILYYTKTKHHYVVSCFFSFLFCFKPDTVAVPSESHSARAHRAAPAPPPGTRAAQCSSCSVSRPLH